MSSWVKVSRKLLTSAIASKPEYLAVWMHLILTASYKPGEVLVGHQVVKLEAGQLVFGRIKFSQQIGVTEHTLRMALKSLETLQQITIKSQSKFSVITITNWDKYQSDSPADHQQATSKPPASHHNKDIQESQEENQKLLASADADTKAPGKAKKSKSGAALITIENLVEQGCDPEHARDWLAVRKKKRADLTPTAWAGFQREAAKAGITVGRAVEISAERSWQSFKAEWLEKDNGFGKAVSKTSGAGRPSLIAQVHAGAAEQERRRQLALQSASGADWESEFSRIREIDGSIVGVDD